MLTDRTPPSRTENDSRIPKISIGMPVFNGEKYIREALDSLLSQTFTDFELIISDNASIDGTEDICRAYAENDPRIRYVRQPENRGGANFWFLLDEARGDYFMWAACDDVRSHDFLEINYDFLRQNPDYIASTSPMQYSGGNFDPVKMGDGSLVDSLEERVIAFFECWHANGRFYSLFRREALLSIKSLRHENYLGVDWAISLELISIGKFNRCKSGEVILGTNGLSRRLDAYKIHRKGIFSWLFPFKKLMLFTLRLSRNFSLRNRFIVLLRLIKLNNKAFISQFVYDVKIKLNAYR